MGIHFSKTRMQGMGLGLLLMLAACGANDSHGADDACSGSETRCDGQSFQTCNGDYFEDHSLCAGSTVCDDSMGCVECHPGDPRTCVSDDVYECNTDGTLGDFITRCDFEQCQRGTCGEAQCELNGTQLIYLIDSSYRLISFDPNQFYIDASPFTLIGDVNCPADLPYPEFAERNMATPFSMSVDRGGIAYVLYTSGEIFNVSTQDASCQRTNWVPGAAGFQLFGMGFVSDAPGSNAETLFIAGGASGAAAQGNWGRIDKVSLEPTAIAPLPSSDFMPELTGTGDASFYGYWPGSIAPQVANIDKESGERMQRWDLNALDGDANAWAFAHWGGKFYLFVTSGTPVSTNRVWELDPATGISTIVVANSPYRVVGAGVSTCAPTRVE